MLGPNRNSEREAYIFYMAEELPREKIFFLHKYTTNIIKYRDLSGLSIGVLSGAIYFDKFNKNDKLKHSKKRKTFSNFTINKTNGDLQFENKLKKISA